MKVTPSPFHALAFLVAMLSLLASGQANAREADKRLDPVYVAEAGADSDDDEEDEEEESVNYRDRVREIQDWMNRRDSERKGDAPSLNVAPVSPRPAFPKYFRDNGYNENGFRNKDENVRTRLRDAPSPSYAARYHSYHHSWHKRWHKHVRPRIHGHHGHHGSRHAYKGNSHHPKHHGSTKGFSHEYHLPHHRSEHGRNKHEHNPQAVKSSAKPYNGKSQHTQHSRTSSKSATKKHSKR